MKFQNQFQNQFDNEIMCHFEIGDYSQKYMCHDNGLLIRLEKIGHNKGKNGNPWCAEHLTSIVSVGSA